MRRTRLILTIFLLAAAAIMLLGAAEARTIIVDDDWSGADYNTISAAIGAAKDGDTIRVYDGTYNEANDVHKSINLVGNGTSTIIDGHKKDHTFGFNLMGGGCNVSGFYFYYWWPTHHYAGVGVYSNDNAIFDNTFYYNGRGIFLENCQNNLVFNNTFDKNMYGLLVYDGAVDCNVSFNYFTRHYNAALMFGNSAGIEIFSNTVFDDPKGGLTVHRSNNVSISFNMFYLSEGVEPVGAAMYIYWNEDTEVHNNTFIGAGRAIWASGTLNLRVEHNAILKGVEGLVFYRAYSGRTQTGPYCNGTVVRNNNIQGQSGLGINATDNQVASIDARNNWWGDPTGPYDHLSNGSGAGVAVTDLVVFDPWLDEMVTGLPPIGFIRWVKPSFTNEGDPIEFRGRGLARNWTDLHVWTSSIDGEIYNGTDLVFTLTDLSPGTHTITLKVRDEFGEWSEGVSTTIVINGRPIASIKSISPIVVNEGGDVTFTGSYVDYEDDIRYIEWKSDIDGVIGHEIEFTTNELSNGTHFISFLVRDGHKVWSNIVNGEVTVNGIPRALITTIEPGWANDSEPVIFRGDFIDAEDSVIEFFWESDIDGVLSDQARFYSSSLSNGTHNITFRVMDDFLVWSDNVTATLIVNGIPQAVIESISPDKAIMGEPVTFNGAFIDHEGSIVAYEWKSDVDGPLSTSKDFTSSDLAMGNHVILFRVMDHHQVWSSWVVTTIHVNGRPIAWIDSETPVLVNEGQTVRLVGGFSDPENDIRGYLWASDIDGEVGSAWDLTTSSLSNGTHYISFRVMDGFGVWSKAVTVTVTVNGIPRALIIDLDPTSAQEGEVIEFSGDYVDHENDVQVYEWTSDKDGLLGGHQRLSSLSLSNGTHEISFRVMDGNGVWSEAVSGRVKVNGRPRAWIEDVGPVGVMEGETVHFSGKAIDDLAVVAYRWSSSIDGLLSEISVFSTGDLSPGTHDIIFKAQDDKGTWSEATTVAFVVKAIVINAEISGIDLPHSATERENVTIGCMVENTGNVPLLGLTIRFSMGGEMIGTVDLDAPLHPGSELAADISWTAVVDRHVVLVEVVHRDVLLCSALSDSSILVEPAPEPPEVPTETPVPSTTEGVEDGTDWSVSCIALIFIGIAVAATYMIWTRKQLSH